MPIDNRTLTPRDKFVATYKKQTYRVQYHPANDEKRPFVQVLPLVMPAPRFRTLSDAGKAIMGGIACNGWRFFSRDDGSARTAAPKEPKTPRVPTRATRPTPIGRAKREGPAPAPEETAGKPVSIAKARQARAARARVVKQIKRIGNQGAAPEGQTRWWCSACMNGFNAEGTARPAVCPQGHPAEVEDDLAPEVAIPAGMDE